MRLAECTLEVAYTLRLVQNFTFYRMDISVNRLIRVNKNCFDYVYKLEIKYFCENKNNRKYSAERVHYHIFYRGYLDNILAGNIRRNFFSFLFLFFE